MATHSLRRSRKPWLLALCLPAVALVSLPGAAVAADGDASTVRAVVARNGDVKDVMQYAADGSSTKFSGELPVELTEGTSKADGRTSYRYHVENTLLQTQDVTYTDTAGKTHSTKVEVQLPLVAQLGVTLPSSMKDVRAAGATITTDPDGTKHLLWQMVLFSPLGAPVQDVIVSATGNGTPSAQLRATPVDPTSAAGLSGTAQAANQAMTQDDFWHQYASGGNEGLTKLREGMGKIVAGLELLAPGSKELASGLGAAGDGARKLDDGTAKAKDGAVQLSAGLGKISTGQSDLTKGLTLIHDGQASLTTGLEQIHAGQGDLTTGLTQIHDGQASLTTGLGQLSGGLAQLADPAKGLPAAQAGLTQIDAGLTALQAGVGKGSDSAADKTLVGGVTAVSAGLGQLQAGIMQSAGCSAFILTKVLSGFTMTGATSPCFASAANPTGVIPTLVAITDPMTAAVVTSLRDGYAAVAAGSDTTLTPGIAALSAGLSQIRLGLSHPAGAAGATDPGGVSEGLTAVKGGIALVKDGLAKAIAGVDALNTGAAAAYTGSQALSDGSGKALDGSKQLYDGSGKALAGSKELTTGSGKALDGSKQLAAGSGAAYTGSKSLVDGLGQLSSGQHQVAAGLPAAVDGAKQIADGIAQVLTGGTQVRDGIGEAQDKAVAPLEKQLAEGSQNARQQVAILSAAGAMAAKAPGGAGTSYVLGFDPDLAAASSSSDDSDTTRNALIALGGLALLAFGVTGGYAAGRRRTGA